MLFAVRTNCSSTHPAPEERIRDRLAFKVAGLRAFHVRAAKFSPMLEPAARTSVKGNENALLVFQENHH
jgi:hypothetical protein